MFPISIIVLEVTTRCNLQCKHCYLDAKKEGEDISIHMILKLANELKRIKPKIIAISGGESLLHPKIYDIIKILRPLSEELVVETNGLLLNDRFIHFLKKNRVIVQLSLEGTSQKLHDKNRGKNVFINTTNILSMLKNHNVKTAVLFTPISKNFDTRKLNSFSKKYNCKIGVERFIPIGRGNILNTSFNFSKFITSNSFSSILCTDPLSIINKWHSNTSEKIIGCTAGIIGCCISADGSVFPCPKLRIKCGNLKNKTLNEIWKKSRIFEILRNRKDNLDFCKNCIFINECGGCRAHALAIYKNWLGRDPLCPINFIKPYKKLAEFYDKIMKEFNYKQKANYLLKIIKKMKPNAKVIYDIACGTGEIAILLGKKSYEISGFDISEEMLKMARKKIKKKKLNIKFIKSDMKRFHVKKKGDVVISTFDSMNYITKKEDMKQVVKKIHSSLVDNGIFIFDINTTQKASKINNLTRIFKFKNGKILWKNEIIDNIWNSYFLINSKNKYFHELHTERFYGIDEIKNLIKNYFSVVACYDNFTFKKASPFSDRVCFVLKKFQ